MFRAICMNGMVGLAVRLSNDVDVAQMCKALKAKT